MKKNFENTQPQLLKEWDYKKTLSYQMNFHLSLGKRYGGNVKKVTVGKH